MQKSLLAMYKINNITLEDGQELVNPEFEIGRVTYDWKAQKARIEVLYHIDTTEGQRLTYSRTYEFECTTTWTDADAEAAVLGLDLHTGYNEI